MNKDEALQAAWTLYYRYPGKRSSILSRLEDKYGVTTDDFNAYDINKSKTQSVSLLEQRAAELESVPGFSQVDTMSDDEILRVFNARDDILDRINTIKEDLPTDEEWYHAGLTAEERIQELKPFYETKMAEEWEGLESALPWMAQPLEGPIQALTEVGAGWVDIVPGTAKDFGETLHERGMFTSFNPLTGFGAWDIAEFKVNPETGQRGFTPELLAIEEELNELYGVKRQYNVKMQEGGYRDVYGLEEELQSLNQIIIENKLLNPKILGENR